MPLNRVACFVVRRRQESEVLKQDKSKWNERYLEKTGVDSEPDPFLVENSNLFQGGRALDLACGLGANSIFLSSRNYWVDSIDISESALRKLQGRSRSLRLELGLVVADLDYYPLPQKLYDLILVFYFFSEALLQPIADALKPVGALVYCTYNYLHTSLKPDFKTRYLVPKGGLAPFFREMEVILDEPETGEASNLSRLIARKPRPPYNC